VTRELRIVVLQMHPFARPDDETIVIHRANLAKKTGPGEGACKDSLALLLRLGVNELLERKGWRSWVRA
jgi:hypothetical protein